ncbi:phosphotransferase enzyme family protein [Dictyobacter kobayashii]|uniref:Spectinomycin phosphotransferase n=1 Tax=Dictyobacter kobayashii TaxID=2014872 RepID=A0A402ARF8_9CHLR|nr:phosphotransferase [Dictyobacter kobayashii]GCE21684.1 spectinomycin phosphotransferase [Dictyobacter kobayashii]
MREKPAILDEQLRTCLQEYYAITVAELKFLPLGLDMQAGVYRVVDEQGASYLLKLKAGLCYEPGCTVPRYLAKQGITSVVAPLPTTENTLWTRLGKWTVMLYPFIDGVASFQAAMSEQQWRVVGMTFRQIHQTRLPAEGFPALRTETFDPTGYSACIAAFEKQHTGLQGGSSSERALRSDWMDYQPTIHAVATLMEELAPVLQRQAGPHVICHADLHPGNLIRNQGERVFVIDWDEVMLAPKERDFLFVGEGNTTGSVAQKVAPFFQGYGATEIDWVALTYYKCERVVQDLIVCFQDVFYRDDLEEETRAASAQLFHDVLAPGGEIEAAFAAATHLPANLHHS